MLLPAISPEEYAERKKQVLAIDFLSDPPPKPTEPIQKPLHAYQTGEKNLYELVIEKWTDENNYLMNQYNEQVYRIAHQPATPKDHISRQIGIAAHDYIHTREEIQSDFTKQSYMASLYVKRQEKSLPALRKISQRLSRFLIIGALISCASLGYDMAKREGPLTPITQMALGSVGLLAAANMVLGAEQRRIHREGLKIKSNLMSWHHMTPDKRSACYREITAPCNMGLCGFLDTFQRTA